MSYKEMEELKAGGSTGLLSFGKLAPGKWPMGK